MNLTAKPEAGQPYPLGATWDGNGTNFALFSASAESVELCLFDPQGEETRIPVREMTDHVWHCYLPGLGPGAEYGYRIYGPFDPGEGHWFNPAKLLLDPYARCLTGPVLYDPVLVAHQGHGAEITPDPRDSARAMPRCIVTGPGSDDHARPLRPGTAWQDTIVYEGHVKGLSQLDGTLPAEARGTFAGLAGPRLLDHLSRLGITAIELLPVQAMMTEAHLVDKGLTNYWGYNSIGFFVPEPRYLGGDVRSGASEFRAMVDRFHDAGIEVILDVVYNHTAEADELGPMLSFRGIDNASYYRLIPGDRGQYINDTGTGNTLNTSHPRVIQMVMDSLRYWAEDMNVDGFRFDLATALGREANGFDPDAGFFDTLRQDPVLADCKLIAEPWDVGPGGYQLGRFPAGFSEWNDRFRDGVRRFWRGDEGILPDLAARLLGSADVFDHNGRRPWTSVNFVTAHDGFTMRDTVSYKARHNLANGEGGADGHSENYSANYGVEGPSDDAEIEELRWRQMRNMAAALFMSQGTPMWLAGDEIGNSQAGNNNAYAQDNETGWINWTAGHGEEDQFFRFVAHAISVRRSDPLIPFPRFFHGEPVFHNVDRNVAWLAPSGEEMTEGDWTRSSARAIALHLQSPIEGEGGDTPAATLILLNSEETAVSFRLPNPPDDLAWQRVLDTDDPEFRQATDLLPGGTDFTAAGRSLAVFRAVTSPASLQTAVSMPTA